MATISIIASAEIDKVKWNNCVANNSNGLVYAYSFYLDAMAKDWYGLVIDDYATIFPIAVKKKYGFTYCYMPAFTQQLGFIGSTTYNIEEVTNAIQSFVKYGSPYLNFSNQQFAAQKKCTSLNNYIINLNDSYEAIKSKYKKTIAYSLSKASKANLAYTYSENIDEAIELYKQYNHQNIQHITDVDYGNLKRLLVQLQKSNQIIIRKAVDQQQELASIVLLIKDNKRLYNLLNYTTPNGRKIEANYFLYDSIFNEFANQALLFDFEGSDLPGVQAFYEKFGAINQPYFHWHFNHLPLPFRLIKK